MTSYYVERWDGGTCTWVAWYPWGSHKRRAIKHCARENAELCKRENAKGIVKLKFRVVRIIKSVVYTSKP